MFCITAITMKFYLFIKNVPCFYLFRIIFFNDRVVLILQICYQFLSCSPVRPPSHKDSLSAAHVHAAFQSRGFGREQATYMGLEASAVHNQPAVGF